MAAVVVATGKCNCPFGDVPCVINVTSQTTRLVEGKPVATIQDSTMANLPNFGMCKSLANPQVQAATAAALGVLTPMPCTPVFATPWMCSNSNVIAGSAPILTNDGTLQCTLGQGTIKITDPGQTNVII